MLAERQRALRLLADRQLARLWIYRFSARSGAWLLLLGLLAIAPGGPGLKASIVVARFLPPLLFGAAWGLLRGRIPFQWLSASAFGIALILVVGARAVEHLVPGASLVAAGAALGLIAAVDAEAVPMRMASLDRTKIGPAGMLGAMIDRAALLAAGLVAVFVLDSGRPLFALLLGGAAFLIAGLTSLGVARVAGPGRAGDMPTAIRRSLPIRSSIVYLAAGFGGGALAVATLTSLLVARPGVHPPVAAGALLALIGAGMLIGPLPVPRMLLRIPAPMLTLACSGVMTAAVLATLLSAAPIVAFVALIALGMAAVTQDGVRAIATRRLWPESWYSRAARASMLTLGAGQVFGAAAIMFGSATWDPVAIVVAIAVGQLILVGIALVVGGVRSALQVGGLSELPVKSVVHKLSWETRPPAVAADFSQSPPRVRRLAKWITRHVVVERLEATLPVSKRLYEIYRPDDASRERLFEEGRTDPEKQMPYWAKVWPSGVALADVVVERRSEVANRHVLELGAGLGVTACAVLESDGQLVTADYSALPLAHCRLNTLVNTGKAPRSTCFNWRHDAEVEAAMTMPDFGQGFPLILAADVLYEGRDAEPLLNVVERLLTATGSLWLAEPVRRTAQRFLDSAAALGWDTTSRQVQAAWPDATSGPVNLHFLTRSPYPDAITAELAGWRI